MRLSTTQTLSIIKNFNQYFQTGDIYLFGSRVDDNQKGGDIDLFIDTSDNDVLNKKIQLMQAIKNDIGEQKIDIVLSSDKSRAIEQEALSKGIKLDIEQIKQQKVINECEKHLARLLYAKKELAVIFPLTEAKYKGLSSEEIQDIDQFIYRFSKLQDTVGNKLIKIVFSLYEEDIQRFTFIDVLNRLEKAELLLANDWQELREVRNILAHDYEDEPSASVAILNRLYEKEQILEKIYDRLKESLSLS